MSLASSSRRSSADRVLAPPVGFQRLQQGSGAAFEVIDGAGSGQIPGEGDHPEAEVVVRDAQLQGSAEERRDGRVELTAGEELESRAEGAVVDDLFTGLS